VFIEKENIVFAFKWPSLVVRNEKNMFYEEKSLVGLTPSL
jgi:hypothetical protein